MVILGMVVKRGERNMAMRLPLRLLWRIAILPVGA